MGSSPTRATEQKKEVMDIEQAKEVASGVSYPCDECPFNEERTCDNWHCRKYYTIKGVILGYNKALEEFGIPNSLAENRGS